MIPKKDNWNIVLAGFWNRAIFTPDWVGRVLFGGQRDIDTLISIMPHMPIIYRNRPVALEVAGSRLAFRPRALDDDSLTAAETMAHTVLRTLQDTPLLGVGINFGFVEEQPHRDLVALFDSADSGDLEGDNWAIEERSLVRRIDKNGDTLILTLTLGGGKLDVEFNFHTETTENAIAQAAVNHRVIRLRDAAVRLLDRTYNLQVDWEERGDG